MIIEDIDYFYIFTVIRRFSIFQLFKPLKLGFNLDNGESPIMSDKPAKYQVSEFEVPKVDKDGNPISKGEQKRMLKEMKKQKEQAEKAAKDIDYNMPYNNNN